MPLLFFGFFAFFILCPDLKLFYFVPLMSIILYRYSFLAILWAAFGLGLISDVFMSNSFFGIQAGTYCLVAAMLYKLRHRFFADSWSTFILMTFLFSFLTSFFLLIFSIALKGPISFSFELFWIDFILMAFLDVFYGILFFMVPFILLRRKKWTCPLVLLNRL